ncbi:MAG: RES domain-containing protein [Phenylobacterium sp.]|jgi:RES domain-containing protein
MEVYRLAHPDYTQLTGSGGLFGSGRWHHRGNLCVYTASSRGLAALERFVHESTITLPKLKMLTIWLPDDISIQRYCEAELPQGWDTIPDGTVSRDFGTSWLQTDKSAVLQIPSSIVQGEYNLIINPAHLDVLAAIKTVDCRDFYYDKRLQKMVR